MRPATFKEKNLTLHKPAGMTDEECGSLDVYCDGKVSISKWKMSWRERLACLFFGYVWLHVWFGSTQPPVCIEAKKTPFVKVEDNE